MDIMYVPPEKQAILLLYSFAVGVSLGIICGFIKLPFVLIDRLANNGKARFITYLISDILISVLFTVAIVIFIYAANNGVIRYFMIISAYIGILLYKYTIYRYIYKLYIIIANIVHKLLLFMNKLFIKLSKPVIAVINDRSVKKYTVCLIKNIPRR